MSFDYREFADYVSDMKNLQKDLASWLQSFLTTEAMRTRAAIKRRTPVGRRNGGTLRKNWGTPPIAIVDGNKIVATFHNPTEYGPWVEEGHHLRNGVWWEGHHFTRIPIDEVRQTMPSRFQRDFSKWLRSRGF